MAATPPPGLGKRAGWADLEEKEDEELHSVFTDDELVSPSEVRAEQMLCSKLALDATDMGTLPGALSNAGLYRTASFERFETEERRLSSLSQRASGSFLKASSVSSEASLSPSPLLSRGPRLSSLGGNRLKTSPSSEKLDDLSSVSSPRDYVRRSSNLSQMLATMKKSPSMECVKSFARDQNTSSSPPPPPSVDASAHNLGPRRHSSMAVMRLIAETI